MTAMLLAMLLSGSMEAARFQRAAPRPNNGVSPQGGESHLPFFQEVAPEIARCMEQIAPGLNCRPGDYGIFREGALCHTSKKAMDLKSVHCDGREFQALRDKATFDRLYACLKPKFQKSIWQNCFMTDGSCNNKNDVTAWHRDHIHISNGCGYQNRTW